MRLLLVTLFMACTASTAPSALARNSAGEPELVRSAAAQPASGAKKSARTVKVRPHRAATGGETTSERDRRLLRECQGRPNAGACLGYTR